MSIRVRQVIEDQKTRSCGAWWSQMPALFEALPEHGVEALVAPLSRNEIAANGRPFDLVHLHDPTGALAGKLVPALSKHGVPHLVSTYGGWTTTEGWQRSWWRRLFRRLPLAGQTCLHATGQREARHLRRIGVRGRIEVIPIGVDTAAFSDAVAEADAQPALSLLPDRRILLYPGPIDDEPGLVPFLKATDDLEDALDGWHIILAGDASDSWSRTFAASTRRHGKEDLVTLLQAPNDKIRAALMRRSEIVVLPQATDRPPIGALQAMAYGLPVLISPESGLDEVAPAGAGGVCPPQRGAIRNTLGEMLALEPPALRRMGQAARLLVQERFAWPAIAPRFANLYRSMLEGV